MVSVCLPSEALLQHLPPYLGFSYLGQAAAAGALSAGGCSPEELPHIRVQGQKSGGPPCPKNGGQEELPHVQDQGQRLRVPGCDSAGTAEKSYPASKVRGGDERSYPASEVRGGGREELPHAPTPEAKGDGREGQPTSKEPWLRGRRRA